MYEIVNNYMDNVIILDNKVPCVSHNGYPVQYNGHHHPDMKRGHHDIKTDLWDVILRPECISGLKCDIQYGPIYKVLCLLTEYS